MTKSLFGGIFNGIAAFLGFVWLTIAGGTSLAIWYIANNSKPVVWIAFFAGIGISLLIVLLITMIMVAANAARDIAETKRFQADQKADSAGIRDQVALLSGLGQARNSQLLELQRERDLQRKDLAYEIQQRQLDEPDYAPVVEGDEPF